MKKSRLWNEPSLTMPANPSSERNASSAAPAKPRLPRGGGGGPAAVSELRRFHVGLPTETAAELPKGVVPALLHAYRGVAVRSDYPLFVAPEEDRRRDAAARPR